MFDNDQTWDGRISIEHQIEIHVKDLFQSTPSNQEEVPEILTGLQYVMEYRIRGRQQRHLSLAICDNLVRALLLFTGLRQHKGAAALFGRERRPTAEAEFAFVLLVDYVLQIEECGQSLMGFDFKELKERLRLGRRLLKSSDKNIQEASKALLSVFINFPQDWRELFDADEIDHLYQLFEENDFFSSSKTRLVHSTVRPCPPPSLYFDRDPQRVIDMFETCPETGLTEARISKLQDYYGKNIIPSQGPRPLWKIILSQIADLMIIILMITTVVSAIVDYPKLESTIVLAVVIVLNVSVGLWQELKSSRIVSAMKSLQIPSVNQSLRVITV